jgi:hypothetical protein
MPAKCISSVSPTHRKYGGTSKVILKNHHLSPGVDILSYNGLVFPTSKWHQKERETYRAAGVAQVVEHLASKREAECKPQYHKKQTNNSKTKKEGEIYKETSEA